MSASDDEAEFMLLKPLAGNSSTTAAPSGRTSKRPSSRRRTSHSSDAVDPSEILDFKQFRKDGKLYNIGDAVVLDHPLYQVAKIRKIYKNLVDEKAYLQIMPFTTPDVLRDTRFNGKKLKFTAQEVFGFTCSPMFIER